MERKLLRSIYCGMATAVVAMSFWGASAYAGVTGTFGSHSLVVAGSYLSNQEVEGAALIGGNMTGQGGQFGFLLPVVPGALNPANIVLTVAGDINVSNINLQGNQGIRVGGTLTGNINPSPQNPGGAFVTNDPSISGIGAGIQGQLAYFSASLDALSANSSVDMPNSNSIQFVSAVGMGQVAVFDVSAGLFESANPQLSLVRNGASAVVINVFGAGSGNIVNVLTNSSAFVGNDSVIFNFVDATAVSLERTLFGAVLAPSATVTVGSSLEGSLFAAAANQTNGEIHLPLYTGVGFDIAAVPEPSAMLLVACCLAAAVGKVLVRRS